MYSGDVVENYFDNLLPDRIPIRKRLQARVGAEIGRDCVGALQLVPEDEEVNVKTVTVNHFSDNEIEEILSNNKG